MSRSGSDDARAQTRDQAPERSANPREPQDRLKFCLDRLNLPRTRDREPVSVRGRVYQLRGSEARILATVGTFRTIRASELQPANSSREAWTGDLRALAQQGLLQLRTIEINKEPEAVAVLTMAGKELLEAHRSPADGPSQEFHAGLVKPREIAHDSQLHRLFLAEAARIEGEGGRVIRVALDYELKRDYQAFLNRPERDPDADREAELKAYSASSGLPIVDGHLELPDLRIEYETTDEVLHYRDVELATEHYSRGQMAGKSAAGFAIYRAAGAGGSRGSSSRRGGTPSDPHLLERLV